MSQRTAYLVDDDSLLVRATADQLRDSLRQDDVELRVCDSLASLDDAIKSDDSEPTEAVVAIVDLWMIDKTTNRPDMAAGFKAIDRLRSRWPDCYVIIYSGHIDETAKSRLSKLENIAIIEKPVPTFVLTDTAQNVTCLH